MLWVCCWILWVLMTSFFAYLSFQFIWPLINSHVWCFVEESLQTWRGSSVPLFTLLLRFTWCVALYSGHPSIQWSPLGSVMRLNEIKHPSRCQVTLSAHHLTLRAVGPVHSRCVKRWSNGEIFLPKSEVIFSPWMTLQRKRWTVQCVLLVFDSNSERDPQL